MIEIKNFVKNYGSFRAVHGIDFNVEKGQVLGLLGPNGAGKSTTIRTICGYLKPTEGTVKVAGYDVIDEEDKVKEKIGYLPESAPIYPEMLVYDYLSYIADIRGVLDKEKRINELAGLCGLREKMYFNVKELSKGYRQRVGLAHALMSDPDLLVLDEPTSGLDPNQIAEIRELIKEIGKEKTVILSTHILPEVEATCDRVVIISNGKKVADSPIKDIKGSGNHIYHLKLIFADKVEKEAEKIFSGTDWHINSCSLQGDKTIIEITKDSSIDPRIDLYKKIKDSSLVLLEMHRIEKSFENIFRELTQV